MTLAPPGTRHARARCLCVALLTACAGLTLAACGPGVATPIPEPPTLQLDHIGPVDGAEPATQGGRHLVGEKGAAPAGALVSVINLDRTEPVVVANVAADGSFDLRVAVQNGEELRLGWLRGQERGEPVDALFVEDGGAAFHLDASPRLPCVQLTPGFVVGFGGGNAQTLLVQNQCAAPIALSGPRTRLGLIDFQLQTTLPLSVPVGQSATLSLAFARSAPTAREDVLFIDVTSGTSTLRYPISLFAPAAP